MAWTPCPSPRTERFYTPSSTLSDLELFQTARSSRSPTRFFIPASSFGDETSQTTPIPCVQPEWGAGADAEANHHTPGAEFLEPEDEYQTPGAQLDRTPRVTSSTPSTEALSQLPTSSPPRLESSQSRLDSQIDAPSQAVDLPSQQTSERGHETSDRLLSDNLVPSDHQEASELAASMSDLDHHQGLELELGLEPARHLIGEEEPQDIELDIVLPPRIPLVPHPPYAGDVPSPIKGFHLSSDGGLQALTARARALDLAGISGPIGVQCFSGSPRRHAHARMEEEEVAAFRESVPERRWWTLHSNHTTNLASADE